MNDCSINQKKVGVDKDLPKIGTITIPILYNDSPRSFTRLGGYSNPVKAYIKDGYLTESGSETPLPNPCNLTGDLARKIYPSKDTVIEIQDKYNLGYFNISKYIGEGVLSGVMPDSFFLELEEFEDCKELRTFNPSFDVVGNIEALKRCIHIEKLNLSYGYVTGDVTNLVKEWIKNRRSSSSSIQFCSNRLAGTLYNAEYMRITFCGDYIPNMWALRTLGWESATKIYLHINGTTIWCTGYTAEEIAANTGGTGTLDWTGKTVVSKGIN